MPRATARPEAACISPTGSGAIGQAGGRQRRQAPLRGTLTAQSASGSWKTVCIRQHGREVWLSDRTTPGTRLLLDIQPGPPGSEPFGLVVLGRTE
ncbi:MAG: hypothetical protein R6W93_13005 [Candidatus Limnocylindrales bacterium]